MCEHIISKYVFRFYVIKQKIVLTKVYIVQDSGPSGPWASASGAALGGAFTSVCFFVPETISSILNNNIAVWNSKLYSCWSLLWMWTL